MRLSAGHRGDTRGNRRMRTNQGPRPWILGQACSQVASSSRRSPQPHSGRSSWVRSHFIFRVGNEDDAVVLAIDSDFGLGKFRLHKRHCTGKTPGEAHRYGHCVRQSPEVDGAGLAVRRNPEFRVRARAFEAGDPGVREQEAGSRRRDRCAAMTVLIGRPWGADSERVSSGRDRRGDDLS